MFATDQCDPYQTYTRDFFFLVHCQQRFKKRSYRLIKDIFLFPVRQHEDRFYEKLDKLLVPVNRRRRIGEHFELLNHGPSPPRLGCGSTSSSIERRHAADASSETKRLRPTARVFGAFPRFL